MEQEHMINAQIFMHLHISQYQKNLGGKTIKAYRTDLRLFSEYLERKQLEISKELVSEYIMEMNSRFKPSSVKRKIASLKAFFIYLEEEELLGTNPFHRLRINLREPQLLPRTIPLRVIEKIAGRCLSGSVQRYISQYTKECTTRLRCYGAYVCYRSARI